MIEVKRVKCYSFALVVNRKVVAAIDITTAHICHTYATRGEVDTAVGVLAEPQCQARAGREERLAGEECGVEQNRRHLLGVESETSVDCAATLAREHYCKIVGCVVVEAVRDRRVGTRATHATDSAV